MKITYLGHSCFCLEFKNGVRLITDPYTGVGYELPKIKADIVTVSHGHFDHNYLAAVSDYALVANEAKSYRFKGIEIEGIESFHDPKGGALRGKNVIFKIKGDGLTVCHLGDLGEPYSQELKDRIGAADILLLPIGGTYTVDADEAKRYAQRLAVKKVIPMHYRPNDGKLDIDGSARFLKLFDESEIEPFANGREITEKDITKEKTLVLYMERGKIKDEGLYEI